jgi:thymidylate kinase
MAARISNPWGDSDVPSVDEAEVEDLSRVLRKNKVSFLNLAKRQGTEWTGEPFERELAEENYIYSKLRAEFERVRLDLQAHGIDTLLFKATGLYPPFPQLSSNIDVLVKPGNAALSRRRLWKVGYVELVNVEERVKFLFRRFLGDGTSYTFHLHEAIAWGVPFVEVDAVWHRSSAAEDDDGIRIPGPEEALLITTAHWFYEDKDLTLQNLYLTADALRKLPDGVLGAAAHAEARGWLDGFCIALRIFDEAWRRLFGRGGLGGQTRSEIDEMLRKVGGSASSFLRYVRYPGDYPAKIPFYRNKLIYYRKLWRDSNKSAGEKLGDFVATLQWAARLKLRVRSQPPLLVTLSGCDGSGKTAQAERFKQVLDTCELRSKILWARGASSPAMGVAIRTAKRIVGGSKPAGEAGGNSVEKMAGHGTVASAGTPVGKPGGPAAAGSGAVTRNAVSAADTEASRLVARRRRLRNPLMRFFFALFYGLDLAWVYAIKARFYLLLGYVVICDRYVYDSHVDFALMSGKDVTDAPLPLRLLEAISPKPHAAFVLDVDPEEALRRKPEEGDATHLTEARRMFHGIAASSDVEVIDPGADMGEVHEHVVRHSLTRFYKRYRTFINWLLGSDPAQLNPAQWRVRREDP